MVRTTARRLVAIGWLPVVLLLVIAPGLSGHPVPAGPGDTRYALPKDTEPRDMVLATDGALWLLNDYAGVTRLDPSGATREFLRRDESLDEIAAGPDGSVRVPTERGILRVDPGQASGGPTKPVTAWFADSGTLIRVDPDGSSHEIGYRTPRDAFEVNGIAPAPDGSVWFTEYGVDHHHWIGRMTAAGAFTHTPLPRVVGEPDRIATAPDGSAWFTGRHVIGHVTPGGPVTSFRLGGEAAPHDIVAGTDGAMWFVSDACLGRITGAAAITTWPVAGALRLERIAAAADGSVWLMDRIGNAIHRFDPSAATPAPCGAPRLTRSAGRTSGSLAFQRYLDDFLGDLHVHIARAGQERFTEAVPGIDGAEARTSGKGLITRDLDGDGEPEVMLTVNWNGTQCCSWTRFYRYDAAGDTYRVHQRFWGYFGAEPVLGDLDGDGRPELRSLDDRFSRRFTYSLVRPLRIWSYRAGGLHDVTGRFPGLVRADAAKLWRLYRHDRSARAVLPAWMADQYRLGRQAHADRVLAQAAARGELKHSYGFKPRSARDFMAAVKRFLRERVL